MEVGHISVLEPERKVIIQYNDDHRANQPHCGHLLIEEHQSQSHIDLTLLCGDWTFCVHDCLLHYLCSLLNPIYRKPRIIQYNTSDSEWPQSFLPVLYHFHPHGLH